MSKYDASSLELEEPFTIQIARPVSTRNYNIKSFIRRIFNLNDVPNKKQHLPLFIIAISILHISIYFSRFIYDSKKDQHFAMTLYHLFKLYIPCMRPTSHFIRSRVVKCIRLTTNGTCYYDEVLKQTCFTFLYPNQLWRMITVNFSHLEWLHLLSNLLAQLVQGIPLERKYGSICIAIIYWLSGLGANLSFMTLHRTEEATGASGSLYGLMLFLIVDRLIAIQANVEQRRFLILQLTLLLLPHIVVSIPLIIKFNVAHSAHVGGGLVGFLIGIGMLGYPRSWNNRYCIRQITCRLIAFILLCIFYVITISIFFIQDVPVVYSIYYSPNPQIYLE
ncbi:unnamed protein product [Adineta steineri]|uniref:rhomboid protease n=1 Tax=Adineta steineri TaxID=433720 RepID=A0A814FY01_9BILA|nr:unnamed protein product [Adineta steineri]CAF0990959.1 unnamed protein product [Adineta steineri]